MENKELFRDGFFEPTTSELPQQAPSFNPTAGLDFGQAIRFAKNGRKVARAGWNGANMYAVVMPGYPNGIPVNDVTATAHGVPAGHVMRFRPYWALYTAQGDVASWAPSGSDTLAEDWMIVD